MPRRFARENLTSGRRRPISLTMLKVPAVIGYCPPLQNSTVFETVLDSGFHAVHSGFHFLDSGFLVRGSWIPDSGFAIPLAKRSTGIN